MPQRIHDTCTVEGCQRPHKARGYCQAHYQHFKRGVPITAEIKARDHTLYAHCSEDACREPVKAKGLCRMHYARLLRHGHTKYRDRKRPPKMCSVPGCESWLYAKGLCNRHYVQQRSFAKNYDLTPEAFSAMLQAQSGVCAICGNGQRAVNGPTQKVTDLHVDHCHVTGIVRGLLCSHCNRGLGLFQDRPDLLDAAAAYLRKHQTQ